MRDRDFDAIMDVLFPVGGGVKTAEAKHTKFRVDTTPTSTVITLPTLGAVKGDVSVSVEENKLVVSVKPSLKSVWASDIRESFLLGQDSDVSNIDAKLDGGVLTLTIPRLVPEKKVVTIKVN